MKRVLIIVGAVIILLLIAGRAWSASERGNFVTLPLHEDVYVTGDKYSLKQDITGDLVAAGGTATLGTTVGGDVLVVGGDVTIGGAVHDDVRAAGGMVTVKGSVGGDVVIVGGDVRIERGAMISGDVVIVGGTVMIDGLVRGNVWVSGGDVQLSGTVGSAQIEAGALTLGGAIAGDATLTADNITLVDGATIGGRIEYWTEDGEMDFGSAEGSAHALFNPDLRSGDDRWQKTRLLSFLSLFGLLSSFVALLVFLLLMNPVFTDAAKRFMKAPATSLLVGLGFAIFTPLLALFLLITVIGIPIGLLVVAIYAFSVLFSSVLTAMVFAKVIQFTQRKRWGSVTLFSLSLGLIVALKLLWLIPVIGWLLYLTFALCAVGAITMVVWGKWRKAA